MQSISSIHLWDLLQLWWPAQKLENHARELKLTLSILTWLVVALSPHMARAIGFLM